ncbi:phosphatase PAP2 family protein [Fredinandcohnia humi]
MVVYKKNWYNGIFYLTVTFSGIVINLLLKIMFMKERPGESHTIEFFNYSLNIPSYSFPSGHTMRAVILCCFILYLSYITIKNNNLKVMVYSIIVLLILGVAISRIMLGAHFLSDTIAAISISISWFCFLILLSSKLRIRID